MIKLSKLIPFKQNRKVHWENLYEKQSPAGLGWYQPYPEMSLKLINATGVGVDDNIIDVGGGTSKLTKLLLKEGYKKLTVLDISANSIEKAKIEFGKQYEKITWIEADVANFNSTEKYDIWHDRAVFHFLTDSHDRERYIDSLNKALKVNGYLIIATFGLKGPRKCNGLNVVRYSAQSLHKLFTNNFDIIETFDEVHITPSKIQQKFIYCSFKKRI